MEPITLLFVLGLILVGLIVTLLVRRDIVAEQNLARERRRRTWRAARGR